MPSDQMTKAAQALLDAAYEYWRAYQDDPETGNDAVVWLEDTAGHLVVFTRSDYRDEIMAGVERTKSRVCYWPRPSTEKGGTDEA